MAVTRCDNDMLGYLLPLQLLHEADIEITAPRFLRACCESHLSAAGK